MSQPKTKPRQSIKIPPGQAKKMSDAVSLLSTFYAPVLKIWSGLTPEQRQVVLEHSPLLVSIVALARPVLEAEHGERL
jgi:hypothetical protein